MIKKMFLFLVMCVVMCGTAFAGQTTEEFIVGYDIKIVNLCYDSGESGALSEDNVVEAVDSATVTAIGADKLSKSYNLRRWLSFNSQLCRKAYKMGVSHDKAGVNKLKATLLSVIGKNM